MAFVNAIGDAFEWINHNIVDNVAPHLHDNDNKDDPEARQKLEVVILGAVALIVVVGTVKFIKNELKN